MNTYRKEEKYGYQRTKASEPSLYHNTRIIRLLDIEEQQQLLYWSADNITGRK